MSKPVIRKIKSTKEQQQEIDLIKKRQVVPSVNTIIDKKLGINVIWFSKGDSAKALVEKDLENSTADYALLVAIGRIITYCLM